jgi:hypothetical protein
MTQRLISTRTAAITIVGFIAILVASTAPQSKAGSKEKDWALRRQDSGVCHVQLRTASPLGSTLGLYDTRKEACKDALDRYEAATTSDDKCGTYGGGTVDACKKEGIDLPH